MGLVGVLSVVFAIYFRPIQPVTLSLRSNHASAFLFDHVVLQDDEILAYDWDSHTLFIPPGMKMRLHQELGPQDLVSGIPFEFFIDDRSIYSGHFVTSLSSSSMDGLVIDLCPDSYADDRLAMTWDYPAQNGSRIPVDPRYDNRVYRELWRSGRLKQ